MRRQVAAAARHVRGIAAFLMPTWGADEPGRPPFASHDPPDRAGGLGDPRPSLFDSDPATQARLDAGYRFAGGSGRSSKAAVQHQPGGRGHGRVADTSGYSTYAVTVATVLTSPFSLSHQRRTVSRYPLPSRSLASTTPCVVITSPA